MILSQLSYCFRDVIWGQEEVLALLQTHRRQEAAIIPPTQVFKDSVPSSCIENSRMNASSALMESIKMRQLEEAEISLHLLGMHVAVNETERSFRWRINLDGKTSLELGYCQSFGYNLPQTRKRKMNENRAFGTSFLQPLFTHFHHSWAVQQSDSVQVDGSSRIVKFSMQDEGTESVKTCNASPKKHENAKVAFLL